MANKTEKLDLKTIKPGATAAFDPVFEVESVEGRAKSGGDYIYAKLKPVSGGASEFGAITLRMPAILAPGSTLNNFAVLTGQDPAKGFDLGKAKGARIRLTPSAIAPA